MTAPSTQVTTLLTQFGLTTATDELVPRLTQAGRYWTCTEDDLTDRGRAILEQLRALYPGREIHLTTWLDT